MIRRAWLYLTRKYKRSMLLLLLMSAVSASILTGLCVGKSIHAVTVEIERTLGTSINFRLADFITQDQSYCKYVKSKFGNSYLTYDGPDFNWDTVNQILKQVDGITDYNIELLQIVHADNISLVPGMYHNMIADGEEDGYDKQFHEVYKGVVNVYGNEDTSLNSKFRTGAFELIEGRHIRPGDTGKALISDELARLNQLKTGDSISLSDRAGILHKTPAFEQNGNTEMLEIVGIFHINGYQPVEKWVAEIDMTYNWIFADVGTVWKSQENMDQDLYNHAVVEQKFDNVTFFVEDPSRLPDVLDQLKHLKGIDTGNFDISVDDTMFKSTVDPLNSIRNLVGGLTLAIVAGCAAVLLIVFTMWVRSRRQEIAVYLSMGISRAAILGQFILEAGVIAVLAGTLAFAACRNVPDAIGNRMLASRIEDAQPEAQEVTKEQIHQAIQSGTLDKLFAYQSGGYAGPDHIDFRIGASDFVLLILLELLLIACAVCTAGRFIFKLQPREIMTSFF
ncbi:MAG: FtsX-like permease family protein [Lachnospiraceae bacterium]|nr:FtsX-like permease family protein [Lachnospiraceae bacterium]MCI1328457.1 FtsX-like permease family protein [Lachnospiraceae bacterium]